MSQLSPLQKSILFKLLHAGFKFVRWDVDYGGSHGVVQFPAIRHFDYGSGVISILKDAARALQQWNGAEPLTTALEISEVINWFNASWVKDDDGEPEDDGDGDDDDDRDPVDYVVARIIGLDWAEIKAYLASCPQPQPCPECEAKCGHLIACSGFRAEYDRLDAVLPCRGCAVMPGTAHLDGCPEALREANRVSKNAALLNEQTSGCPELPWVAS